MRFSGVSVKDARRKISGEPSSTGPFFSSNRGGDSDGKPLLAGHRFQGVEDCPEGALSSTALRKVLAARRAGICRAVR